MNVSSWNVAETVGKWEAGPIEYGSRDCGQFAAFVVQELTGEDYMQGIQYSSEGDADDLIDRFGGLCGVVAHQMRRPAVEPNELRPGAVVVWRIRSMTGLGICLRPYGTSCAAIREDGAVLELDSKFIQYGWNL